MVECRALMILSTTINPGGMAEWTKAVVLKTTVGETSPGVRIPLPPPEWLLGEVPEWTIGAAC